MDHERAELSSTQIVTLSLEGGWVVTAVTRQMLGLLASTTADSIVIFGKATVARLSQERAGFALGIDAFGTAPGAAPRPRGSVSASLTLT